MLLTLLHFLIFWLLLVETTGKLRTQPIDLVLAVAKICIHASVRNVFIHNCMWLSLYYSKSYWHLEIVLCGERCQNR